MQITHYTLLSYVEPRLNYQADILELIHWVFPKNFLGFFFETAFFSSFSVLPSALCLTATLIEWGTPILAPLNLIDQDRN